MTSEEKQHAFLRAFLPIHTRLDRYVRSMIRNEEDARDIIGDTILDAFLGFNAVRSPEAFLSFVFTIARRKLGRFRWRQRLFRTPHEDYFTDIPSDTVAPDTLTDIRILQDALVRLPFRDREVLALHELSDLPLARVAEIQDVSLAAVKQRVSRARTKLARLLRNAPAADSEADMVSLDPAPTQATTVSD